MGEAKRRRLNGEMPTGRKVKAPSNFDAMSAFMAVAEAIQAGGKCSSPKQPLSDRVKRLLRELNPEAEPVFLPFTRVSDLHFAGQCHGNVLHWVREHGGERVNGWLIWENRAFAEGEWHAVWRSPKGDLVDITPRLDSEDRVLFLPDPHTKITKTSEGRWLIPCNRTDVPECPFTCSGKPMPRPFVQIGWDDVSAAQMAAMGIDDIAD